MPVRPSSENAMMGGESVRALECNYCSTCRLGQGLPVPLLLPKWYMQ
jgi:hypothetical protein